MNGVGDDTPNGEVHTIVKRDGGVVGVFGLKLPALAGFRPAFDGKFAVEYSKDNVPVTGCECAIYDQDVVGINADSFHGMALNPDKKCRCRGGDEEGIEIDFVLNMIICRGWKAC